MAYPIYPASLDAPAPDFETENRRSLDHESMFLETDSYLSSLPAPQKVALDSWLAWSPDPMKDKRTAVVKGYLADVYGLPDEQIANGAHTVYRDRYARETLGVPYTGNLSDDSFFELVKGRQQKGRETRIQAESFASAAVADALKLTPSDPMEAEAKMQESAGQIEGAAPEDTTRYFNSYRLTRAAIEAKAAPLRPVAREVYDLLSKGKKDRLGNEAQGGIETAIDRLAELPEDQRGIVVAMLKSEGGQDMTGAVIDKTLLAAQRGLIGQLRGVASNADRTAVLRFQQDLDSGAEVIIPGNLSLPDAFKMRTSSMRTKYTDTLAELLVNGRPATDAEKKEMRVMADKALTRSEVAAQAIGILEGTIDPIKTSGMVQKTAVGVGSSVGAMIPAFVPYAGLVIQQGAFADQEYQRQRAMGTDPVTANTVAQVTGTVQAGLDRVQALFAMKLPGLSAAAPAASNMTLRVGGAIGGVQAAEYAIESAQDAVPILTSALAGPLGLDLPAQAQMNEELKRWKVWNPEMFMTLLPLSLFGGGYQGLQETAQARQQLSALIADPTSLQAVGIAPAEAQRIAALPEEERVPAYVEAYPQRDPSTPEAAAAQQAVSDRTAQEIERGRMALANMEEQGFTIERKADGGYVVRKGEVETRYADEGSALSAAMGYMSEADRTANQDTLEMMQAMMNRPAAPVAGAEVGIGGAVKSARMWLLDRLSEENNPNLTEAQRDRARLQREALQNRMDIFEKANPDEKTNWNLILVDGQSSIQKIKEGVYKAVIKLSNGADIETVFEEFVEADLGAFLATGQATEARMLAALREVETLTGDTYLLGHTDGQDAAKDTLALKEAYSKLAHVFVRGQSRAGQQNKTDVAALSRQGRQADARSLRQRLVEAVNSGAVDAGVVARLKAAAEWMKATLARAIRLNRARRAAGGTLAVDEFLNKSIGMEADAQHAAGVVAEAERIYTPPTAEQEEGGIAFNLKAAYKSELEAHLSKGVKAAQSIFDDLAEDASTQELGNAQMEAMDEIFHKLPLPDGWEYTSKGKWVPSGQGSGLTGRATSSWYAEVENEEFTDADGEPEKLKLSVRDHENFSRQHGSPDFAALVPQGVIWDPEEVAKAVTRIMEKLAQKSQSTLTKGEETVQSSGSEKTGGSNGAASTVAGPGVQTNNDKNSQGAMGNPAQSGDSVNGNLGSTAGQEEGGMAFSLRAMDAEYMAAVEAGDVAKQQAMVDAAAKAAGLKKMLHGSKKYKGPIDSMYGTFWVTDDADLAEYYAGYPDDGEFSTLSESQEEGPAIFAVFVPAAEKTLDRRDYEGEGMEEKSPVMDANFWLRSGKHKSVMITNISDRIDSETIGDSTVYGVSDTDLIKSADPITRDEQGNVIPLSQRFNPESDSISFRLTPEQEADGVAFSLKAMDAEYMAAVEAGDVAKQLVLTKDAANAAGYDKLLWHGTLSGVFDTFDGMTHIGTRDAAKAAARRTGNTSPPQLMRLWVKVGKSKRVKDVEGLAGEWVTAADQARAEGYNSLVYVNEFEDPGKDSYLVFDSNQLKSADPITRDASGNVIPLSQRFNPASDSISFRLTPIATLDRLAAQMAKQTRDPEARRKVYDQMMQAFNTLRARWSETQQRWNGESRPIVEQRSKKELDKEQAFREAAAVADAEERIMDSLSMEAQAALGMTGEDTSAYAGPLAQRFTGGRFGKPGRILTKSAMLKLAAEWENVSAGGEYNGAEGLPSIFFGGTLTADEAADEAHREGEIDDAKPDTLWDAMRKELQTQAKNRDGMKAALATLKAEQKQARNTAREEAANWRTEQDEMQAKDWDARAVMLRHLRTLDALISALPAEIRAKIGGWTAVASLKTQAAMQKELENRLAMADRELETFLKKEAMDDITALVEKAKPDREAGKKSKGKLGAAVHRFFDEVERVMALTPEQVESERVGLNAAMTADGVTEAQQLDLFEKEQVLDMFGALGKPAAHDAAHLTRALDLLEDVYVTGRNRWRMLEEARLEEVKALAENVIETLGGVSYAGTQTGKAKSATAKGKASKLSLDIKSFPEVMAALLGEGHPLAKRWSRAAREAFAQKNDSIRALRQRWKAALEAATGKKGVKARRILWEMGSDKSQKIKVTTAGPGTSTTEAIPISLIEQWANGTADPAETGVTAAEAAELIDARLALDEGDTKQNLPLRREKRGPVEVVPMNEAQGVFLTMLAAQEQYAAALDKAGWDADAIEQVEEQLSDAAKSLRSFMAKEYQEGYAPLAKVFERMFGVGLPQIKNYAPAAFYSLGTEQVMDPTGSGTVEGGFRAGFLKNRKNHAAAPKLENAFATFFGHVNQTAHWRGMAETVRELSGVFGKPEVKRAIEARHGAEMLGAVNQWLKALEGNGLQVQSGLLDQGVRWLTSQQSYIALAWKLGTLMKQSSALLGAAYKIPTGAYLRGFAKLMTGQLDGKAMFNSPAIQRRLETGFAPEVRAAMNDIWNAAPSRRQAFLELGMELIGLTDAIFTTGSAAIAYDYHLAEAKKAGMGDTEAAGVAMREVDDMVGATAQPADAVDRSLFELRQGAFGKLVFLFASEARQKSSLWATAWGNTLTGKGTKADARVLALAHLIVGPAMQAITAGMRDARDDDDEELFDPQNWDPMDFLKAVVAGPLAGLPLIGSAVSGFTDSGVLGRFVQGGGAAKDLFEGPPASEDETAEWYFKRITKTMQALDSFTGTVGSMAGQTFGMIDNAWDTPAEDADQKKRKEAREKREAKKEAAP